MSSQAAALRLNTQVARQVHGNVAFALDLYRQLCRQEGNLFFSPYSISSALAMTYAGARGNTAAQLARALHFGLEGDTLHATFAALNGLLRELNAEEKVTVQVANALWPCLGYAFLPAFLDRLKTHYGVSLTPVDFRADPAGARQQINAWAEQHTGGKIKDLIPDGVLTPLTRLVLTNAIYFKGRWERPFDPARTQPAPFSVRPGQQVMAPTMAQTLRCGYGEEDELEVLELSYVGRGLSMIVLLPREVDGLARLEEQLTVEALDLWVAQLWHTEVQVFLPRFTVETSFRLDSALKALGAVDAFDRQRADFSGMDGSRELYLDAVLHKAFVEVAEEGTEAAAATAAAIAVRASMGRPLLFRVDHPFLFLIRENSVGSILFMGRVVNPTA
ncbi:MAG: serpin family protein [Caldilineales bacterium]|nr:serpin family protein [Caldilineales bacterium]MDW8318955.1 serpin family protein [Anaerolineae bacterium]